MSPLHGYRAAIEPQEPEAQPQPSAWLHGPCLHLDPRGRRCERPALEDGFCYRHAPGSEARGPWVWFRRLAALLLAAAILWPIIEAFLEQLPHGSR